MKIAFDHIRDPFVRKRVEMAAERFIAEGKDSETVARRLLAKKGKCTVYDLVKQLGWNEGKAQGTIKRLKLAGIIKEEKMAEENGRLKKYYSLRLLEELESDIAIVKSSQKKVLK